MRCCLECGRVLPEEWIDDLCEDCMNNFASAVINTEEIWPSEDDF